MPSTFLQLTNRLLRRLNEVEISESDFMSVTGIQSTAKNCILDSINEINLDHTDWPFNAVQHTQTLEIGIEEYAWPSNFTMADWASFQLLADDTLNIKSQRLHSIAREEWYMFLKDRDDDAAANGIRRPTYVAPSHGWGFAVSPSPDKEYPIRYRYYKQPVTPENYNDQVTIPDRYDYVIMAGALYHLNIFKENAEAAQLAEARFRQGLAQMSKVLLPNNDHMFTPAMNSGSSQRKYNNYVFTGYNP